MLLTRWMYDSDDDVIDGAHECSYDGDGGDSGECTDVGEEIRSRWAPVHIFPGGL